MDFFGAQDTILRHKNASNGCFVKTVFVKFEISNNFKQNIDETNRKPRVSRLVLKGTVWQDFRLLVFFMNQFPPSTWVYLYGHFKVFQKFAEIFTVQGAPPVSLTPLVNRKNLQAEKISIILFGHLWVVEWTYKFFAFNFTLRCLQPDIVPIICHGCQGHKWKWWQNLPSVSLIPVANLLPVSLIPAAILPPVANLTPVVHLALQILKQIHNDPNVIFRGSGEGDSWKKPEAKNLVTLSL
jgi:hypothetical protein